MENLRKSNQVDMMEIHLLIEQILHVFEERSSAQTIIYNPYDAGKFQHTIRIEI